MATSIANVFLTVFILCFVQTRARYKPSWDSLDTRPLPKWYDEAKFGIFLHWGVFSVPSFGSEWFWEHLHNGEKEYVEFMKKNYPPGFTYADFAPMFTTEFYNASKWADIFRASGAKYVVLTSKHHEGWTNWPSNASWNWNSMDMGPHRDLVGELASAIRSRTDIHFGLYHSLFEWFNPLFLKDKDNQFKTQYFVTRKTMPELYDIVNAYKPDVIWSDGDWGADPSYWKSMDFLAWLYNDSPVKDRVVTNDRWGAGTACKHGGYYTCHDKYNPGVLQKHKWENCMTIDCCSWGYRREATYLDYMGIEDLIKTFVETISCGGNLLMNIGPTHDGRIIPVFEERLRQMGSWLKVNGEAVYSSKPWIHQNDTITKGVWYTKQKSATGVDVYAFMLEWPKGDTLTLGAPTLTPTTIVTMLGYKGSFTFKPHQGGGMDIHIPAIAINKIPSKWAWVFKLQNLQQ